MAQADEAAAEPVWLDLEHEELRRGDKPLHLRPKSFALLRYLVAHPGRVLSKDELVEAMWPKTAISDGVLTVSINEVRRALGDMAQAPQYLETLPRRGYRWRGALRTTAPFQYRAGPRVAAASLAPIGREAEVSQLQERLAQAQHGARQVLFVTGEPGIGKTTVVDAFLAQIIGEPDVWLARGQCIESYGTGEAYLPVLEALGQLCRGPDGDRLIAWLAQHAPTWLVQMPALLAADALEATQRRVLGATRERMLREFTEALDALTAERALVLVLEDLHWSDAATLDLVAALARRRNPARLLLLATYRPVDVIVRAHPLHALKLDLTLHRQCRELPLQLLSAADVAEYLARRFGVGVCPAPLAQALYRRTDGHPLFLVTVVDALVQQGLLREGGEVPAGDAGLAAVEAMVPESLQQMIAQQLARLSAEQQRVLDAASVAGVAFSAAAVAAVVEAPLEAVEEQCASLARQGQFLEPDDVEAWPDGTVAGRYRFRHALDQAVVYARLTAPRAMRLHRQIGSCLEAAYGSQAREYATALAEHFVRGRDDKRAAMYLRHAGENALRRWAHTEAIAHFTRGLEVLQRWPETTTRAQQELDIQLLLASALEATRGFAAPEVGRTYTRAQELCGQLAETPRLVAVLRGLRRVYFARGEVLMMKALAEEQLRLAEQSEEPSLLAEARAAVVLTAAYHGDLAAARAYFEQGIALYGSGQPHAWRLAAGQDPGITWWTHMPILLWLLGSPAQALQQAQQVHRVAERLEHPFSLAYSHDRLACLHVLCGDWAAAQEHAQAVGALATAQGFRFFQAHAMLITGRARVARGETAPGLAQMRQGVAVIQAIGQIAGMVPTLSLLAEAYALAGQVEAGQEVLDAALDLVVSRELRLWEAEVHRLRGALLLAQHRPGQTPPATRVEEAAACFQQALTLARKSQARGWELRAATSLARLWQQQGQCEAARALLAPVYGWFTEGFDTADLQEAQALLKVLSAFEPARELYG
jgi:DNA-binding winged helix-turn-helix (wHTH) protein/predicted ATPase